MADVIDSKYWCQRALSGVLSLWDDASKSAWRTSQHLIDHTGKPKQNYFPTATFHAILAMGECGLWLREARYEASKERLNTQYLQIPNVQSPLSAPDQVFDALLAAAPLGSAVAAVHADAAWAESRISSSSHRVGAEAGDPSWRPRQLIPVGHLLPSLRTLLRGTDLTKADRSTKLIAGLNHIATQVLAIFSPGGKLRDEVSLSNDRELSPILLLNAARLLRDYRRLNEKKLAIDPATASRLNELSKVLRSYFLRHVDRLMARRSVRLDPDYDVTSLVFATRGLLLLHEPFRKLPVFRSCIQAVVDGQSPDGWWPDGVSITNLETGDTLQQPSVEIALQLADCVFRKEILFWPEREDQELTQLVLPALRKLVEYLAASFRAVEVTNPARHVAGWASDRTRSPNLVEMWITAIAARLFQRVLLLEKSSNRAEILSSFNVAPKRPMKLGVQVQVWDEDVVEPDAVTQPCHILRTRVIDPLGKQFEEGNLFLRPKDDGVSFIIYGPPGSGKTFFVDKFAATLGWPLVLLNPGHFIKRGLEFIEDSAGQLFRQLMDIDHAVVFFDECDELFRDREDETGGLRNILSFATASMLPKLQELHDARKVIFFLGTNYLSNIDTAVRRAGRFDAALLFDRPDDGARKQFIQKTWKKESGVDVPDAEATELVEETVGWTAKEIIEHVKPLAGGKTPTAAREIGDYVDWCAKHGEDELLAANARSADMKAVLARWKSLPGFEDRKKALAQVRKKAIAKGKKA